VHELLVPILFELARGAHRREEHNTLKVPMIEAEHHRNLARGRVGCTRTPHMELTPGRYPRYYLDGMYPSFVGLSRVVRARHRQIMFRAEHLGFGRLGFNKSNTRALEVISLFAMLLAHEWRGDPHRSGGISPGILRRSHVPSPHRPLAAYRAEIRMHNSHVFCCSLANPICRTSALTHSSFICACRLHLTASRIAGRV